MPITLINKSHESPYLFKNSIRTLFEQIYATDFMFVAAPNYTLVLGTCQIAEVIPYFFCCSLPRSSSDKNYPIADAKIGSFSVLEGYAGVLKDQLSFLDLITEMLDENRENMMKESVYAVFEVLPESDISHLKATGMHFIDFLQTLNPQEKPVELEEKPTE